MPFFSSFFLKYVYLFLLSLQALQLQVFLRNHEVEIRLEEIQIVLLFTRFPELELWEKLYLSLWCSW